MSWNYTERNFMVQVWIFHDIAQGVLWFPVPCHCNRFKNTRIKDWDHNLDPAWWFSCFCFCSVPVHSPCSGKNDLSHISNRSCHFLALTSFLASLRPKTKTRTPDHGPQAPRGLTPAHLSNFVLPHCPPRSQCPGSSGFFSSLNMASWSPSHCICSWGSLCLVYHWAYLKCDLTSPYKQRDAEKRKSERLEVWEGLEWPLLAWRWRGPCGKHKKEKNSEVDSFPESPWRNAVQPTPWFWPWETLSREPSWATLCLDHWPMETMRQ